MGMDGFKSNFKLILIAVGALCLIIFFFQNFEMISFQFLFFHILVAPKWVVLTVTFLLGFIFGYILAKKKTWADVKRDEPLV
jgi:uncharacterized integral membrane protein